MSLFPEEAAGPGAGGGAGAGLGPGETELVSFKAGRLDLVGSRATPLATKGLVRVVRTAEGLVHFQWLERRAEPGLPPLLQEDFDLIVFPGDAYMKKLSKQSAQSARLVQLKFVAGKVLLFWMQTPAGPEADAEDQRLVEQVNTAIGGTPPPPAEEAGAPDAAAGPSAAPPAATDARAAAALLAGAVPELATNLGQGILQNGPSLAEVLKPETIIPLLSNPEIQSRLEQYLPEEHRNAAAIMDLANSVQFQQQIVSFSQALQSGQLDVRHFGLNPEGFSVADFLASIEAAVAKEAGGRDGSGDAKEEGDDMDTA